MYQRIDTQRFVTMPDGTVKIVRSVKAPTQAGISFFYREPTELERMAYELAERNAKKGMQA